MNNRQSDPKHWSQNTLKLIPQGASEPLNLILTLVSKSVRDCQHQIMIAWVCNYDQELLYKTLLQVAPCF